MHDHKVALDVHIGADETKLEKAKTKTYTESSTQYDLQIEPLAAELAR